MTRTWPETTATPDVAWLETRVETISRMDNWSLALPFLLPVGLVLAVARNFQAGRFAVRALQSSARERILELRFDCLSYAVVYSLLIAAAATAMISGNY